MMDYIESETLMMKREQEYIADLAKIMGEELNVDLLAVMAGLYRSGWRDCYREMGK